jgi:hypothetical protein
MPRSELFLQIDNGMHYQADDAFSYQQRRMYRVPSPPSPPHPQTSAFRTANVQMWAPNWDKVANTLIRPCWEPKPDRSSGSSYFTDCTISSAIYINCLDLKDVGHFFLGNTAFR